MRRFDDSRKIEAVQGGVRDGCRGALTIHVVRASPDRAVEPYIGRRRCLQQMQFTIGGFDLPGDFTVNSGHAVQRNRVTTQVPNELLDLGSAAADYAFV